MAQVIREFKESPMRQGEGEIIAYTLTTTPWGGYTSGAAVVLKSLPDGTDVSSTKLSGSASANGNVITTPLVTGLVAGIRYRMEITWVYSGNTFEAYGFIDAET